MTDAWARASVPNQKVAAIYFDIVSAVDAKLTGVETDIAEVAEIHVMTEEGGVMRMRAVHAVDLSAGESVSLEPGGVHVMLFEIKRALRPGERIPLRLLIEDMNGKKTKLKVTADVHNLDGSKVEGRSN